jgi:microcystin-dependent protein
VGQQDKLAHGGKSRQGDNRMGTPYVGEIRMFAGNFAPAGWMFCQGQLLAISENETLFQLIGTTYGGDGESTFALPNLSSRVPLHVGPGFALGQTGGAESVTLTTSQIPAHSHVPQASTSSTSPPNVSDPTGAVWAQSTLDDYSSAAPGLAMNAAAIGTSGGSQPHDNMIPFLVINFIISMFGTFPSQT